jgi:hypothetical protein
MLRRGSAKLQAWNPRRNRSTCHGHSWGWGRFRSLAFGVFDLLPFSYIISELGN